MPIHDRTRVDAGIFHDFHATWIITMKIALNDGILPSEYYALAEQEVYAKKANRIVIRHRRYHRVIALIEVVSPGNNDRADGLEAFVRKAKEVLEGGIHLLILDLFPTGSCDPQGLHPLIWENSRQPMDEPFRFDPDKPLLLMSYVASPSCKAFIEPVAVGDELPPMPLFLTAKEYVPVSLASTYETAWRALPAFWRDVLTAPNVDYSS